MTTFLVIGIAGLQLVMFGVLQNRMQELRADLESHKVAERLRQVIDQAPRNVSGMELARSSSKRAA